GSWRRYCEGRWRGTLALSACRCTLVYLAMPPQPRPLPPIPDLLSAAPMVRVDFAALRPTLGVAFAMGGSVQSVGQALTPASLPATAWDRVHFERDLFLEELVARCLPVRAGGRAHRASTGYLLRAVAEPPRAPEVLAFRRKVLDELASSDALRAEAEAVYVEI